MEGNDLKRGFKTRVNN